LRGKDSEIGFRFPSQLIVNLSSYLLEYKTAHKNADPFPSLSSEESGADLQPNLPESKERSTSCSFKTERERHVAKS